MNNGLKVTLFLFISLVYIDSAYSQDEPNTSDNTFEKVIHKALEELYDSDHAKDVQKKYAEIFYEYYQKNPDEEYSEWAIVHSFKFWQNLEDIERMEEAMAFLEPDSEVWDHIIIYISGTYLNSGQYDREDVISILEDLKNELTRPESKSGVLSMIAQLYQATENREMAIKTYQDVINLNANNFHVDRALGFFYELESLKIGQKAPDFEAETLDGDYISRASLEGDYVLLEFWATWCGPCIPEIPHLKSLYEKYHQDNFKIIGISLDQDKETLINFIDNREMEWVQVFIEEGWEGELPRLFNVSGIPRMYLLDPKGNIIGRDLRGEEMVTKVESLMDDQQN